MTASPEIQEIAMITGASMNIGAATARELARRRLHVLAGVRRDRDADAIQGLGIELLIIDVTNPDHIRALATRVHGDPQGRALRATSGDAFSRSTSRPCRHYPGTAAGPDPQQGSRRRHQLRGRQGRHGYLWSFTRARSSRSKRSVTPCGAKSPRSASGWSWSNRVPCVRKCPAGRSQPPTSWHRN